MNNAETMSILIQECRDCRRLYSSDSCPTCDDPDVTDETVEQYRKEYEMNSGWA